MFHRSLILLLASALLLSGCTSIKNSREACVTAGAIAGVLVAGADDADEGAAIGGAVVGGVAAWLICRTDTDGDGVLDDDDRCPGTPSGADVDARGCALDSDRDGVADYADACPDTERGAAVDSRGCDKDSDGDGVRDDLDQCPNTRSGTPVNSAGCALDSDRDGVADSADACPNTARGKSVDARGCHVVFTLSGVQFEYASSDLTGDAKANLAEAVALLRAQSSLNVEIQGHTDSRGSEAFNQRLSEQRANSVRNFMIDSGIAASRLTATGKGEAMPIASNDTDSGRAQNRRVEFVVAD